MASHFIGRCFRGFVAALFACMALAATLQLRAAELDGRFDSAKVWQVKLSLTADEYAAMQPRGSRGFPGFGPPQRQPQPSQAPVDPGRETHRNTFGMELPWARGQVTIDGKSYDDVGVRYKGNGTIMDAGRTVKKSLRLDLDRFGGTQLFQDAKKINLHSGVTDPLKYREAFGYQLYREADVAAPGTALAEVWLSVPGKHDDELLGLYTVVQDVDKGFLDANFGDGSGLLLKPEGVRDFEDMGDDWSRYEARYAPKRKAKPNEQQRLISFARLVHRADDETFVKQIESFVDVDEYLRFLAVTAYIANADSLFVLGHNYYLYPHPKTGKLHFFPWDLDRAFANHPVGGSVEEKLDLSLTHPYGGSHRLTERILALPGMDDRYRALLQELATTVFAEERLLKNLDAADERMRDLLARDAEAAKARGKDDVSTSTMFGAPPSLRHFVDKRTESVARQLAGKSKGFIPPEGFGPGRGGPRGPGGPGGPRVGDMMAGPLMGVLDADHDQKLSADEWHAVAKRIADACERDADEAINEKSLADALNEMLPKPPEGSPQPFPGFTLGGFLAGPIIRRADDDNDGKVTADDITSAATAVFQAADKQKSNKLDGPTFATMLSEIFPPPRFDRGPPGVPQPPPRN